MTDENELAEEVANLKMEFRSRIEELENRVEALENSVGNDDG